MKKLSALLLCILFLTSCQNKSNLQQNNTPVSSIETNTQTNEINQTIMDSSGKLIKYSDIRGDTFKSTSTDNRIFNKKEYIKDDITSYTFNESTIFKGNKSYQKKVMEMGKDPGLGIRSLHKQGITGEGVNVAIIDQNLIPDHPEFKGKIVKYFDSGCEISKDEGSMHGPAVTSLLVGNSMGVAPNANVYYAAAPSWKADSKYFADCLYWIIEENKNLPKNQKIRVVSVSAAPSGEGSPFEKNNDLWEKATEKARKDGILVIDCTKTENGFILPGFYINSFERQTPNKLSFGYSHIDNSESLQRMYKSNPNLNENLIVPVSSRTVAEQYYKNEYGYTYCGVGGLSWGIPYAAGVLALGWEVNPDLDSTQMKDLLIKSAYVDKNNFRYINPISFIETVKKTVKH